MNKVTLSHTDIQGSGDRKVVNRQKNLFRKHSKPCWGGPG